MSLPVKSLNSFLKRSKIFIVCLFLSFLTVNHSDSSEKWFEVKDKHFMVLYQVAADEEQARIILRKAEDYYNKIADQIGYARYSNFWTWDERVRIVVFPDQATFQQKTGQPEWSTGYASRDSHLFKSRLIVTFKQEGSFIDGVLPHEITHLIFRDMVGFDTYIPIWFEEGMAQLQEREKKDKALPFMRTLIKREIYIPLNQLNQADIRKETDGKKVSLFYAESLSVVEFLLKEYGSHAFRYLCLNLKEGKTMQESLRSAYPSSIESLKQLEDKWLKYMKK